MHETYLMMAQNQIADRIRDAAAWRLAAEARPQRTSRDWSTTIRSFRDRSRGQRSATAARPADACGGA
jgi:hypothetical protein